MTECTQVRDPRTPGLRDPKCGPAYYVETPEWVAKCGEGLRQKIREVMEADLAYEAWKLMQRLQIGPLIPDDPICPKILPALTVRLQQCAPEFYERCDFDDLIRICPFDPAWDAFEWKQQVISERLEALEFQVKELQPTPPKGK